MNPIVQLDNFILKGYQRFSEWSQVSWGKNCYWWAHMSCQLSGLLCIVFIGLLFTNYGPLLEGHSGEWIHVGALLTISLFELAKSSRFKKWSQQDKPQHIRVLPMVGLVYLVMFLVSVHLLEWNALLPFSWMCIEYFGRCVPLPPSAADERRRRVSGKLQTAQ